MRVARFAVLITTSITGACVSYQSYEYLHPEPRAGYKVRSFGGGVPETAVFGVAAESLAQLSGRPTTMGVEFNFGVTIAHGHSMRFATQTLRLKCQDMAANDFQLPHLMEVRTKAGRGYTVERDPADLLAGMTAPNSLGDAGDYSYGMYSFSINIAACHTSPYVLELPQFVVDGSVLATPAISFNLARARKLEIVPVQ
jgi:hypothetical protein